MAVLTQQQQEQYSNERRPAVNQLKAVAGIGLSIAAYAILDKPLRGIGRALSQRGGLLLKGLGPSWKSAWAAAAAGTEKVAAGVEGSIATFGGGASLFRKELAVAKDKYLPGVGGVLNQQLRRVFPSIAAGQDRATTAYSAWAATAASSTAANVPGRLSVEAGRVQHFKSFFAKKDFGPRLAGAGTKWFGAYAAALPGLYAADSMTGMFIKGNDQREKRPAWYNVPGRALDFAKYGMMLAPGDMLFRGAGTLVKTGAAAATVKLGQYFRSSQGKNVVNTGKQIYNKAAEYAQRLNNARKAWTSATIGAQRYGGAAPAAAGQKIVSGLDWFFNSLRGYTRGLPAAINEFKNKPKLTSPLENALREVQDITVAAKGAKGTGKAPTNVGKLLLGDMFHPEGSKKDPWLARVLGVHRRQYGRKEIQDAAKHFGAETRAAVKGAIENKRYTLKGSYDGVDLQALKRPIFSALTAVKIHIPGTGKAVHPFTFLQSHLGIGPKWRVVSKDEYLVSPFGADTALEGTKKGKKGENIFGGMAQSTEIVEKNLSARMRQHKQRLYRVTAKDGSVAVSLGGKLHFVGGGNKPSQALDIKAFPVQEHVSGVFENIMFGQYTPKPRNPYAGPFKSTIDWFARKLELGPYGSSEAAGVYRFPRAAWKNLTEGTSLFNIFKPGGVAAHPDEAVKQVLNIHGRGPTGHKVNISLAHTQLAEIVDNEAIVDFMAKRAPKAAKLAGSTDAAVEELAKNLKSKGPEVSIGHRMRRYVYDLLGNKDIKVLPLSSGHTRDQLVRITASMQELTLRPDGSTILRDLAKTNLVSQKTSKMLELAALDIELARHAGSKLVNAQTKDLAASHIRDLALSQAEQHPATFLAAGHRFGNIFAPVGLDALEKTTNIPGQMAPIILEYGGVLRKKAEGMGQGVAAGAGTRKELATRFMLERFTRILGISSYNKSTGELAGSMFTKRLLPAAGLIFGLRVANAVTDENPLFAGTMLDEGVDVAAAEQTVKLRLLNSRILDMSGVTAAAKYSEGLLPGSVDSPLLRAARTVALPALGYMIGGRGGLIGAKAGLIAGLTADAALGFGLTDLTKTHSELIEEYSGRKEVPVRRGRFWEVGKTPYQGSQIDYFRPNWFARLKGGGKYTPEQFGTRWEAAAFQPIPFLDLAPGQFVEPNYYARKNYLTRPYPTTSIPGSEMSLIGPAFGATVGKLIGEPATMHSVELANAMAAQPGVGGGGGSLGIGGGQGGSAGVASPYSMQQAFGKQIYYGFTEPAGLFGWAASALSGSQFGPTYNTNELANAQQAISASRQFWNLQVGGAFFMSEPIRRLLPRQMRAQNMINPIRNRAADWLPEDFRQGDPFTRMVEGELRLPGTAYEAARSVSHTFPMRGSSLGQDVHGMVRYMLGAQPPMGEEGEEVTTRGTSLHKQIQDELTRQNLTVAVEQNIYDPYHDVSGTIDLVLREGRGKALGEIKTKSLAAMQELTGPNQSHMSQLNMYLHTTKLRKGYLMYVAREDPSVRKVFSVNYSDTRFRNDMQRLEIARGMASRLLETVPSTQGASYSHADRLKILTDVAPSGEEFYKELNMATTQRKAGLMSPEEVATYESALSQRTKQMRPMDLYPTRFLGNVMNPSPTYQLMSENENIKAAAQYSLPERVLGAGWEGLQRVPNPISTKYFNYQTPLEAYTRASIYGNMNQSWDTPVRSFVTPYIQRGLSSQNPSSGAWRGAMAGFLVGGPLGAGMGAQAGAVYGAAHGALNAVADINYLPSEVKKERRINTAIDQATYAKGMINYQNTGDVDYFKDAMSTVTAYNTGQSKSLSGFMRGTAIQEKSYIRAFIDTQDPEERKKILRTVPGQVAEGLERTWNNDFAASYATDSGTRDLSVATELMRSHRNWSGFDPNVSMKDVKLRMIKHEGLDAHDFGLGFAGQQQNAANAPMLPNVDVADPLGLHKQPVDTMSDTSSLRQVIEQVLNSRGARAIQVNVVNIPGPEQRGQLSINCYQDRTKDMVSLLRGQ